MSLSYVIAVASGDGAYCRTRRGVAGMDLSSLWVLVFTSAKREKHSLPIPRGP